MLTAETQKTLYIAALIGAAILGAVFIVFAVFINRGTLTIIAKAPYFLTVAQLKTIACSVDSCSTVVAPGDYTVTLKKQGYKEVILKVTVPIGGEHKEETIFEFIPFISEATDPASQQIFAEPSLADTEKTKLPATELFFDQNHLVYLARHPQLNRQTLYFRSMENGKLGPETVATSFIRDLKNYLLIPDIDNQNKIAVIDNAADQSALYVVDLEDKTRSRLLTYPFIKDLKWLPGTDNFLFEAGDGVSVNGGGVGAEAGGGAGGGAGAEAGGGAGGGAGGSGGIFLYRAQDREVVKLDLKTTLKNIAIIDQHRLIAATTQSVGQNENGQNENLSDLKFIDYSLSNLQTRLIKTATNLPLPNKVKLADDKKSIYLFFDGLEPKVYELHFSG